MYLMPWLSKVHCQRPQTPDRKALLCWFDGWTWSISSIAHNVNPAAKHICPAATTKTGSVCYFFWKCALGRKAKNFLPRHCRAVLQPGQPEHVPVPKHHLQCAQLLLMLALQLHCFVRQSGSLHLRGSSLPGIIARARWPSFFP